jgi:hypothetical protein
MRGEYISLVNNYVEWLKQGISIESFEDACEITTPFLDRHNDHLQIYVKKSGNGFLLTDDGYIINDLKLSGCELTTERRNQILQSVLNGYGVNLNGDELFLKASAENFPQRKHNFIQAILSVNDLFVMSKPLVKSFF